MVHDDRDLALPSSKEKHLVDREPFSVATLLALATRLLHEIGIESPTLDARILLEHVLKLPHQGSLFQRNQLISFENECEFFELLRRRLCFEPVAYITGHKEFFGHDFLVNEHCLIPRPDTECVIEHCLSRIKDGDLVFDICTGSGAIALTLLKERPDINVIASDLSRDALSITLTNAQNLGVTERLEVRLGDLFAAFEPEERAQLIVSNPPYIGQEDFQNLSRTVRDFEPEMALKAGDEKGIIFYQRLLREAPCYLVDAGFLVLEIGFNQADLVKNLVDEQWSSVEIFQDLARNPRVVVLQKAKESDKNGNARN